MLTLARPGTITSREVIELLDTVVKRGAPVMANNLARMLYRPGGKPRRRKRVLSEDELRWFVMHLPTIYRKGKRAHVLMVLLLKMQRRSEHVLRREEGCA